MGCAICLDGFGIDDSDALRPTTLACGHLFHHSCVQQWFTTSAASSSSKSSSSKKLCPICKTGSKHVIKLYPSDSTDLDRYLQERQLDGAGLSADLLDRPDADQLLSSLLDLNHLLQSYVMAVHGVRLETLRSAGTRIRQLVAQLAREGQERNDLLAALTALDSAAALLSTRAENLTLVQNEMDTKRKSLEQDRAQISKKRSKLEAWAESLSRQHSELDGVAKELSSRQEVQQKRKDELDRLAASVKERESQVEAEMRTTRIQAAHQIRSAQETARSSIAEMEERLALAERKQVEAERERDATAKKNVILADQMRTLQSQVKKYRLKLQKQAEETPPAPSAAAKAKAPLSLRQVAPQKENDHKRPRPGPTVLIESQNLDEELFQDSLYPMPGVSPKRAKQDLAPTTGATSMRFKSKETGWLEARHGVSLGPRVKNRW